MYLLCAYLMSYFTHKRYFPLIVISATYKICLLNYKVSLHCGCTSSLKDLQTNYFICCLLNYTSTEPPPPFTDLFRKPLVVTDTQNRLHVLDCVMESERQVDKQWIRQKDFIITSCGILYGKCSIWLNIVLENMFLVLLRILQDITLHEMASKRFLPLFSDLMRPHLGSASALGPATEEE